MISDNSEDSEPDDPMVSDLIHPFVILVMLRNVCTSAMVDQGALIDSGCTHCLIRRTVVNSLGLHTVKLKTPIRFEQMDRSLLGGTPAEHVTELVCLEIGEHREQIRFIVVEWMVEPVIRGLAWLHKWRPTIWWEGGF